MIFPVLSACLISPVFADDVTHYGSKNDCAQAMLNYADAAEKLENAAREKGDRERARALMMTEMFFQGVARFGSLSEVCQRGKCTYTTTGDCSWIGGDRDHVWSNQIAPLVQTQVNYITSGGYDSNILQHRSISVSCVYDQGKYNFDHCTVSSTK